ncbi:MAG: redox-sensing transcriptional repressor Rex [Candidatus Ancaeobacter aquaticus]|nr:redox-sensing transcriptional repressor Rex [Candidatus Ancaeobacter aquaticus]
MKTISKKTIERVLLYLRTLEGLIKEKRYLVSSKQLAQIIGLTDAQIRKDISSFGKVVGTPGIGYKTKELKKTLEKFVLQQNVVHIVLFGVGNLGTAIMKYPGFQGKKIKIVAAFDKTKSKIGKKMHGVSIYPVIRAPEIIAKTHADIGVIAVPKEYSQEVADVMVLSGLRGIVNFSPISISVPQNVKVKDIDLSIEFLSLFCNTHI